jgi:integrase
MMEREEKRAKGSGSVYQRKKDGRWCASVIFGDGSRKVVYLSKEDLKGCRSDTSRRRAAEAKVSRLLNEAEQRDSAGSERDTLQKYLRRWLETKKVRVRPRTYQFYEYVVTLHIDNSAIARKPIAGLRAGQLQAWLDSKCAEVGPRVGEAVFQTLRAALNGAVKLKLLARNPILGVERPGRRQVRRRATFTPDALSAFLEIAKAHPLGLLFEMAAGLGLRQGELLALQWSDLDLEARTISVRHTLQRAPGGGVLAEPKSEQSRRRLPLPDNLVAGLRAHRLRQNEARLVLGGDWPAEGPDYVFRSQAGTSLIARNITRLFHNLQRQAGNNAPTVTLSRGCGVDDKEIHVRSTEGYPCAGVVRVGREVIALLGKDGRKLYGVCAGTRWNDPGGSCCEAVGQAGGGRAASEFPPASPCGRNANAGERGEPKDGGGYSGPFECGLDAQSILARTGRDKTGGG